MNEQVPSNTLLHRLRTGALCQQEGCRCHVIEARSGCQCAEAADEIEQLRGLLHKNDRWNVETTEDGFRICRGHHDRAVGCQWEYFVPRSAHEPPADPIFPIARLTIAEDDTVTATMYTPGLPPGQHDVYPAVPTQPPASGLVDAIFKHCTVTLWPDEELGMSLHEYPIEHNLCAGKDCQSMIVAKLQPALTKEVR